MYNNLLGRVGSIAQTYYSDLSTWQAPGTPRVRNFIFHEYGFFLQDDWKVSRRLTLNLGLRYDFSGVPSEINGFAGSLDQAASINTVSQIDNFTIKKGAQWYKNDWNNFAPRIGFAWDPKGDGKTAIRGNYGIFYDRIIGSTVQFGRRQHTRILIRAHRVSQPGGRQRCAHLQQSRSAGATGSSRADTGGQPQHQQHLRLRPQSAHRLCRDSGG